MRSSLIIVTIAAGCLAGCRAPQEKAVTAAEPPAVTAPLLTTQTTTFLATVPVTGTLVSNARVDVKAETIGRITRFDKEEGEPVTAGEPVVWVNDENYQLNVRQAESAVKVAEAALERAKVLDAHSRSENERAGNLQKSGGITDKDLQAAHLALQDARAQVLMAEAQCDQARSALAVARKHVRDAIIYSPVSGTIQKKFVAKGAYAEAPTALFTVVDNTRLELESPVAAADLAPIRPGLRVTFVVNTYPDRFFHGQVIDVAAAIDPDTRSAKVRIGVTNEGGALKAGMFGQGEILTGSNAQAIVIPAAAVYRDDRTSKSSYVFVVQEGKATRRNIRIGRERDATLEVLEGLKAGETLVAEQSVEIAEGVRVKGRS